MELEAAAAAAAAAGMVGPPPGSPGGSKRATAVVECPRSMVGRVIGKNGNTIKALQQYSGALIQIDQTVDPTKVTISGTPNSLNLAVSMVTDIVKGTFKGFALLRQLSASPYRLPTPLGTPRPVYAPGYGLIPPSQARRRQRIRALHICAARCRAAGCGPSALGALAARGSWRREGVAPRLF